jgi:Mn-dependent DtxR family transcriptional regulator
MTTMSQSPRDRILWILVNNGGKMERSRLSRCMGVRDASLNHILKELTRDGKIKMVIGKHRDLVSLIDR